MDIYKVENDTLISTAPNYWIENSLVLKSDILRVKESILKFTQDLYMENEQCAVLQKYELGKWDKDITQYILKIGLLEATICGLIPLRKYWTFSKRCKTMATYIKANPKKFKKKKIDIPPYTNIDELRTKCREELEKLKRTELELLKKKKDQNKIKKLKILEDLRLEEENFQIVLKSLESMNTDERMAFMFSGVFEIRLG